MKSGLILAAAAVALSALAWWQGLWRLPDRHNPWAPLVVAESPNWLTAWKLARAKRDPSRCARLVEALPWRMRRLPDRRTGEGCGFSNAWRVDGTALRVGEAFSLACPAVLSLAMWERHTLASAAERHFGEPVVRLEHVGSYACRNLYGREAGARSRHATAEALDVTGFVMRSGRRVRVLADWPDDSAEGAFLRDVHQGACRWFDGVLGPAYNAAHRDHFHVETGGWDICR